ncbi:hypothetical protein MUK42_17169 [Musa troglodytarum]|uniref:Uncharacterized protein n=1 Tax=Musa troglodytarum TaxID=320322 RepID=A0A9E7HND1_9LILI|nr:hypothetical protein MUK42_17169 [Musa troglodytarum]
MLSKVPRILGGQGLSGFLLYKCVHYRLLMKSSCVMEAFPCSSTPHRCQFTLQIALDFTDTWQSLEELQSSSLC